MPLIYSLFFILFPKCNIFTYTVTYTILHSSNQHHTPHTTHHTPINDCVLRALCVEKNYGCSLLCGHDIVSGRKICLLLHYYCTDISYNRKNEAAHTCNFLCLRSRGAPHRQHYLKNI